MKKAGRSSPQPNRLSRRSICNRYDRHKNAKDMITKKKGAPQDALSCSSLPLSARPENPSAFGLHMPGRGFVEDAQDLFVVRIAGLRVGQLVEIDQFIQADQQA